MEQPLRGGWLRLLCAWILAWLTIATAAGAPPALTLATDLAADGRRARDNGIPVVLLFSRAGCSWCDKARREHVNAMAASPAAGAVFRQVNLDRDKPLIDFAGQRSTHRALARRHDVRMTPTLLFLDSAGRPLAEPIVGYRLPEFYGTLIEDAIEDSRARMQATRN